MKLSPQEKAARRAAFRAMSPARKADHIFTYYKWPILLTLIALFIFGYELHRELTRKEPVLYLALANVSVGGDLEQALTSDYLAAIGADPRRRELYLYSGLYLSEDADVLNHEYAYASQMKLMGAVESHRLDLALMNREAYDLLSHKGYLLELSELVTGTDAALLCENEVVLSDNSVDVLLGVAEEEERVTESSANALAIADLPLFREAGFDGEVFLGLIGNSPRREEALSYLRYITGNNP